MKTCELCNKEKQYTQVMTSGRTICSMCYLENYAS